MQKILIETGALAIPPQESLPADFRGKLQQQLMLRWIRHQTGIPNLRVNETDPESLALFTEYAGVWIKPGGLSDQFREWYDTSLAASFFATADLEDEQKLERWLSGLESAIAERKRNAI